MGRSWKLLEEVGRSRMFGNPTQKNRLLVGFLWEENEDY